MVKLTLKIALPIILAGLFTIIVLFSLGYGQLNLSFYVIILLLIVYVFFFGLAVGQSIFFPVKKLLNNATKLSEGDLSSRVYIETKDELSELAELFNKIAEELETSRGREEDVEKSVGIKVVARTRELEETIKALEQKVKNRTIELERLIDESNKLQQNLDGKKTETAQLKKELDDVKKRIGGRNKVRQFPEKV
jgi:methyl-accepting chemotaxis protein